MENYYISFIGDYDYSLFDFAFYNKNDFIKLKICKNNLKINDVLLIYKYDDNYDDEGVYCVIRIAGKDEGHKGYSKYSCKILEISHGSPIMLKNHVDDELPYVNMSEFQTITKISKTETEIVTEMPYDIDDKYQSLIIHKIGNNKIDEMYGDFDCFKKNRKIIEYRGFKAESKEKLYNALFPDTKPKEIAKTVDNTAKLYKLSWEKALDLLYDFDDTKGVWFDDTVFKNKNDLYSYLFPGVNPSTIAIKINKYMSENECDWILALSNFINENN